MVLKSFRAIVNVTRKNSLKIIAKKFGGLKYLSYLCSIKITN
jgi:hypothetical protein